MTMNTILTILLLIALTIAIVCDIIRIFQYQRTIEESKQNAKEIVCKSVYRAQCDWADKDFEDVDDDYSFSDYFRDNFDKYL